MSLYDLTTEVLSLIDSDTCTDEQLQSVFGDITKKARNCAEYHATLESQSDVYDKEIKRLQQHKKAIDNHIKQFKEYVKLNMERLNIDRLDAGIFTIALQNNPESLEIEDENKVPAKYWITTTTKSIDTAAVKADLKSKILVSGATLKQGKHVRFR
jgi:hypothetical protein